jgi:hypothetical protein
LNNGPLITSKRKLNPTDAANVPSKTMIGRCAMNIPKNANIDMIATSITEDNTTQMPGREHHNRPLSRIA